MTYGEINTELRAAVVDLLSHRRIAFCLGRSGNGRAPAWGTPEQARTSADLIQRYRAIVWTYAGRLLQTALPPGAMAPVWNLPLRLDERVTAMAPQANRLPAGRVANTRELGTRQEVGLVEAWRRTAAHARCASNILTPPSRPDTPGCMSTTGRHRRTPMPSTRRATSNQAVHGEARILVYAPDGELLAKITVPDADGDLDSATNIAIRPGTTDA